MLLQQQRGCSNSTRATAKPRRSTPPLRTTTPTRLYGSTGSSTAGRQQMQQQHGLHMLDVSRLHRNASPATPPAGGNDRRRSTTTYDASAVTPGSARSTTSTSRSTTESMAELEHTIAEVLGVRMQSLVDLRQRVDQLSELYRREEDTFRNQMNHVLERSEVVRVSNESREEALEAALAKERADRNRVLTLMTQFKKEGAVVIQVMKDSLREATAKWKAELDKNAKLTAQLRRYADVNLGGGVSGTAGGGATSRSSSAFAAAAFDTTTLQHQQLQQQQQRVDALTQLVQEEDEMIVALQHRNRLLEQRVTVLTQQRDKLLEVDAEQCMVTDAFQKEYQTVQQTLRHCDAALHHLALQQKPNGGGHQQQQQNVIFSQKCDALDRFVKLLMQRLAIEQRQRLKVEEQSARIASAQDQLVQSLEARVKELGGGGGGNTPKQPIPGGGHGSRPPHHHIVSSSTESSVQRQRPVHNGVAVVGVDSDFVSPALGPADSPHEQLDVEFEPQQRRSGDGDGTSSALFRRNDRIESQQAVVVGVGGRPTDTAKGSNSGTPPRMPSLEEQLALVTQEFRASVDEWNEQQHHHIVPDPMVSQHRHLMHRSRIAAVGAADEEEDVDANDL